jgi:acyl-CoA reductase-like NAD-dependent aldehyde dehydrogenase
MKLDKKVIDQIVETVVRKLADQDSENKETANISETGTDVTDGVFRDMTVCIQAACKAQKELVALPLEVRRQLIAAIRDTGSANAGDYGSMEFEETGLGKQEDNVNKNTSACEVMGLEDLVPEVYAGDKGVTGQCRGG